MTVLIGHDMSSHVKALLPLHVQSGFDFLFSAGPQQLRERRFGWISKPLKCRENPRESEPSEVPPATDDHPHDAQNLQIVAANVL